jgi:hypothetical protein
VRQPPSARFTLAVVAKKEISEKEAPKVTAHRLARWWCASKTHKEWKREKRQQHTHTPHITQRTMEAPPKPNTTATAAAAATLDFGSALVFVPDHDEQEDIYEG